MACLLKKLNIMMLTFCAFIVILPSHPAGGAEWDEILNYVPGDVTVVCLVDLGRILQPTYIRDNVEEVLIKDLPNARETLVSLGYGLEDVGKKLVVFADYGASGRRSGAQGLSSIVRTSIPERHFEELLGVLAEETELAYGKKNVLDYQVHEVGRPGLGIVYLDLHHVLLTGARRVEETLAVIALAESLPEGIAGLLADLDRGDIARAAYEIQLPDRRPRTPRQHVHGALRRLMLSQAMYYNDHNSYANSMGELESYVSDADFRRFGKVNYEDFSVESTGEWDFVIRWEGDIEGFAYTVVTINRDGDIEHAGEKPGVEETEPESETVSGVFSLDLTGPQEHGAEVHLTIDSDREGFIGNIYPMVFGFVGRIPNFFDRRLGMQALGISIANAIDIKWVEERHIELNFTLEDELPEFMLFAPALSDRLKAARRMAEKQRCRGNLRQLSVPLAMYEHENEGVMPTGLTSGEVFKKLEENGHIHSRGILICPGNPIDDVDFDDPEGVGYYIDPAIPGDRHPQRAIAADRSPWELNHDGKGVNVLFANGAVKFIRPEDSGPPDKISNPYIEEDIDNYSDTGDPYKHAWIRWAREPAE